MRLFVAVDLDDRARAHVAGVIDALRAESERRRSATRVSWIAPDRLHLTLLFVGEVGDTVATDISERLAPPIAVAPFTMRLGSVGMFPPSGRPRVVWLAIDDGREELCEVQAEIVRRLEHVSFRRESRPFAPHLTLARMKDGGSPADREHLATARITPGGGCTIDHVTLYQSRLSPRGPSYTPLVVTPLVSPRRLP